MRFFESLLSTACAVLAISGCGPAAAPAAETAGRPPAAVPEGDERAEAEPPAPTHPCEAPISAPSEVWPRIEEIRALPDEERAARCSLDLVETMAAWREVPVDLLDPIVERAREDPGALERWVSEAGARSPKGAAQVAAMDAISEWSIGADPSLLDGAVARWRRVAEGEALAGTEVGAAVAAALDEIARVEPLLERVNRIHLLRCLLEVNPLGFAVECEPIHPQGRPIELSWRTATRDGILEGLELTACKGKACRRLRKTAADLQAECLSLARDLEDLSSPIYKEQIRSWLVLPPFRSSP